MAQKEERNTNPTTSCCSKVSQLLTRGRNSLWNSPLVAEEFSPKKIFLSFLRMSLLDPAFRFAIITLPPIARFGGPLIESLLTSVISVNLYVMTAVYNNDDVAVVDREDDDHNHSSTINLRRVARNDLLSERNSAVATKSFLSSVFRHRPPSEWLSSFYGAIAFAQSALADIVSVVMDRKKMAAWLQAATDFKAYLDISGVGNEMEEAIAKPLRRGRLLDNTKILNDIQEEMYVGRAEKMATFPREELQGPLKEGHRMMRFATAAYGTEMIRSALDRDAHPHELENQLKAIAFHCNIAPEDIRILSVTDGGDMKVLRHFVAIDHAAKQVVLALRGTLSISGALIDIQGMDVDYCGCGKAHKGIAEMADNIWDASGSKILELFEAEEELKDYIFTITGHSLGAGAACLLNLKCYTEKLLGDRPVKCYGFAPPPTWLTNIGEESDAIRSAIENTLCYIHDNDCVPLLSVRCIQRLAHLMDTVDNRTEHMWAYERFKIFWNWEQIPPALVDDVNAAEKSKGMSSSKASKLLIPAKVVIWMKKGVDGSYEGFGCDPGGIADMNIFCCEDMVSDHMVEPYEDALDELVAHT